MPHVKKFMQLFSGRKDVHGLNQCCIKEPVTEELYKEHLSGIKRIGIYPIYDNKLTNWIAYDIDVDDFNLALSIKQKAEHLSLRINLERSKSKGYHCLLPGQKIITKEGYKNIEDIKIGEYVLTHKGNFKKVTETFVHNYTGEICEISLNYTMEKISVTSNHHCLDENFSWKEAKDFVVGDKVVFPIQKIDPSFNRFNIPTYEKTTHIGSENRYVITQKRNTTDLTNPKLWWLVGLYLAEGSLYSLRKSRPKGTNSRIIFVIGKKEKDLLNKFISYYKEIYPNFKVCVEKSKDNAQRFVINNRNFFELIKLFGRVKTKHLPRWIMNLNKECRNQLTQGYFAGDGHSVNGRLEVTSVCLDLLKGFQELLLKDKKISSIIKHSDEKDLMILGRKCHKRMAYRLSIRNNPMLGKFKGTKSVNFLTRIKEIKKYNVKKQKVYNLEVEGDNSYVTSLMAVHNCWCFFDQPVEAVKARLVFESILEELNVKCELFPKQDEVIDNQFGNFIFLPLFGGDIKNGRTIFVDDNNQPFITDIKEINKIEVTKSKTLNSIIFLRKLERRKIVIHGTERDPRVYSRGLPCLEKIKQGVPKGHRDNACFRLVINLKEKGIPRDDIEILINNWNLKNKEPVTDRELIKIINSVFKGGYRSYGCDDAIIQHYCDKEKCPLTDAQKRKEQIEQGVITMTFRDSDVMVFRKKDYEYRLAGFEFTKTGKFRVSLTLSKNEKILYKDLIKLDIASNRARFAKVAVDPEIDNDLIKIDDMVRKQLEKEEHDKLLAPKQLYIMTEEEKNEAIKFLETVPNILHRVIAISNRMGVVGEEVVRLMVYLCYTSRIIKDPLSIVVKGEASSGKSFACQNIQRLIPEEGYHFITKATQQAFFHLQEDGLQHRIVYINEIQGSEQADYSIRTAQSEGDLILMMPIKDPQTGDMETVTKRVKGPVGFLITTTKAQLFDENETRNFSIFSDDSPKLTQEIGNITVRKALGEEFIVDEKELNLWKNMQRLLNPDFKVIIPYAKEVFSSFPDKPVRIRRDRERFRVLLEIITLLHQFHRKQEKSKGDKIHLISTLADYYIAKRVAGSILTYTIYDMGPSAEELWKAIKTMNDSWKPEIPDSTETFTFKYRDVSDYIGWKVEKTKKWMFVLVRAGLIDYAEKGIGGKGKASVFRISKNGLEWSSESLGFLPKVEDMYSKYPCESALFYDPFTGKTVNPSNSEVPEGLLD